jgi:hypothetical protein
VRNPDRYISPELDRLFAGGNRLLLTSGLLDWGSRPGKEQLELVIRGCLRHGVEIVIAEARILEMLSLHAALQYTRRHILLTQSVVGRLSLIPDLPLLFIAGDAPDGALSDLLTDLRPTARRIVLSDARRPDPTAANSTIGERYHPQYAIDTFLVLV